MATTPKKDDAPEVEPHHGTFKHPEYGQRVAGSAEDAVRYAFDGWERVDKPAKSSE